jgi:hypothetical protein
MIRKNFRMVQQPFLVAVLVHINPCKEIPMQQITDGHNLYRFLKDIPKTRYLSDLEFLTRAVPEFAAVLGYDESRLFFDVDLTWGQLTFLRADAIIAASRTERPWIIIEVKRIPEDANHIYPMWVNQISEFKIISDSEFAVLLTPYFLGLIDDLEKSQLHVRQYSLTQLSLKDAMEIYELLRPPAQLPNECVKRTPILEKIDTDTFHIELKNYSTLLNRMFAAETNDQKKKSLEALAKYLFEAIPFLACKYSNLRTASSEIDLVIQNRGSALLTFFDEVGRYFLVECKNWNSSVGAAQVRDFLGKVHKSRLILGIIFAKNGISGAHGGADALREIHSAFDKEGVCILVVSSEDLLGIEQGVSFYDLLDKKIDALRFDFELSSGTSGTGLG